MKKTVKKYVAQNVAQKPANPHSRAILTQLPKLNTRVRFPSPAPKITSLFDSWFFLLKKAFAHFKASSFPKSLVNAVSFLKLFIKIFFAENAAKVSFFRETFAVFSSIGRKTSFYL